MQVGWILATRHADIVPVIGTMMIFTELFVPRRTFIVVNTFVATMRCQTAIQMEMYLMYLFLPEVRLFEIK